MVVKDRQTGTDSTITVCLGSSALGIMTNELQYADAPPLGITTILSTNTDYVKKRVTQYTVMSHGITSWRMMGHHLRYVHFLVLGTSSTTWSVAERI